MSADIQHIVVIGGGLAAAKAVETLRDDGYEKHLTVVTEEPHRPYERPPLSKAVLVGDKPPEVAYVHPETFYAERDVDLLVGDPATGVDRAQGHVVTRSGRSLPFDRLLLATGARPRELPLTGEELEGVVTLRTLDDSTRLHDRLREVEHVTVVGAGWIGCEVAAAARTLDAAVTMVDPLDVPLQRVLGADVGAVFGQLHRDHDVDLRLGAGVATLHGNGQVEQVALTDDTTFATELVVVGIGVVPNTELAEAAGLAVDDGILVNQSLVTEDPRIFAAGDVASHWHRHYESRLRVEHWANALNQGITAGHNMLGKGEAYDRLPYFFSDQYDLGMEYVGHADEWDEVIVRGDTQAREFIAFWLSHGRVRAAMNVNVWDVVEDLKALVASDDVVDPARFADPNVDLAELVAPPG